MNGSRPRPHNTLRPRSNSPRCGERVAVEVRTVYPAATGLYVHGEWDDEIRVSIQRITTKDGTILGDREHCDTVAWDEVFDGLADTVNDDLNWMGALDDEATEDYWLGVRLIDLNQPAAGGTHID